MTFFLWLLYVQIAFLALVAICSLGSLVSLQLELIELEMIFSQVWCLFLRSLSQLLRRIEVGKFEMNEFYCFDGKTRWQT